MPFVMTEVDYKRLFQAEIEQFFKIVQRRKELKKELESLNKEVSRKREGVIGLAALAQINVRKEYPEVFARDVQADIGLTDAIRRAFDEMAFGEGYSPTDIREELEDAGFPIHHHKNPIASITAVLKRLVDAGQVIPATDKDTGRTIYFWAAGASAEMLRKQDDEVEIDEE